MTAAVLRDRPAAVGIKPDVAAATILALVLAFAAGNRWFGFGRDYLFYVEFYDRLGLATKITEERFEPGFTAGAWLFKYVLGLPYAAYATVLVGGALAAKFALFFRTCRYPLVACLVYCAAFYPLHDYTQIRIAVALAFGLWGAVIAVRGRPLLGSLLIVAGAAFQSSEIVVGLGVAMALLLRLRMPVAMLVCLAVAGAITFFSTIDPISLLTNVNPLAQDYIGQLDANAPNFFSAANIAVMGIAAIALIPGILRDDQILKVSILMLLLSVVSLAILRDIPVFAFRLRELFSVFVILVSFSRSIAIGPVVALGYSFISIYLLYQAMTDGLVT